MLALIENLTITWPINRLDWLLLFDSRKWKHSNVTQEFINGQSSFSLWCFSAGCFVSCLLPERLPFTLINNCAGIFFSISSKEIETLFQNVLVISLLLSDHVLSLDNHETLGRCSERPMTGQKRESGGSGSKEDGGPATLSKSRAQRPKRRRDDNR